MNKLWDSLSYTIGHKPMMIDGNNLSARSVKIAVHMEEWVWDDAWGHVDSQVREVSIPSPIKRR